MRGWTTRRRVTDSASQVGSATARGMRRCEGWTTDAKRPGQAVLQRSVNGAVRSRPAILHRAPSLLKEASRRASDRGPRRVPATQVERSHRCLWTQDPAVARSMATNLTSCCNTSIGPVDHFTRAPPGGDRIWVRACKRIGSAVARRNAGPGRGHEFLQQNLGCRDTFRPQLGSP